MKCQVCKQKEATRTGVEYPNPDTAITHGYFCDTCIAFPGQAATKPANFTTIDIPKDWQCPKLRASTSNEQQLTSEKV